VRRKEWKIPRALTQGGRCGPRDFALAPRGANPDHHPSRPGLALRRRRWTQSSQRCGRQRPTGRLRVGYVLLITSCRLGIIEPRPSNAPDHDDGNRQAEGQWPPVLARCPPCGERKNCEPAICAFPQYLAFGRSPRSNVSIETVRLSAVGCGFVLSPSARSRDQRVPTCLPLHCRADR
jgi:hypothetical protein